MHQSNFHLRRSSRGFALLLIVLALLGIFGVILLGGFASGNVKGGRDLQTAVAMGKAKEALLAYAMARADDVRPGEFPCPTVVAPGAPTYGDPAGGCATIRIGRLPWRKLGIPELLDSNGEPLWYAVSNNFRTNVSMINGDTTGTLTIYENDGVSIRADRVVAIIFSPGAPVAGQNRASAVTLCPTTGTSISGTRCAANYLDISAGQNNATNSGPYIAAQSSASFNDQIVYITTADFIPRIEDRIVTILKRTLDDYYVTNGYYPYAAYYSDIPPSATEANCANNIVSGRLPLYIAPPKSPKAPRTQCVGLADWQPIGNPNALPDWFTTNQWNRGIYYAIGAAYAKGGTKTCVTAGNCFTVDGDNTVQAVFILPGTALPTQNRPSTAIADYIEDAENQDGWPGPGNYTYVNSGSKLPTRDRVVAIKN